MWLTNSTNYNASVALSNQTISWAAPPDGWDGFALLVDDVERYVGSALNFSLAAFESGIPHFFRLAVSVSEFSRLLAADLVVIPSSPRPMRRVTLLELRHCILMEHG